MDTDLPKPNWRKDIPSILLLLFLYILQGIPLGLIVSVPFLLQSRGISYAKQAQFSLASWPFSFKVLFAPIIDAIYYQRLGRRKSWLIPLQYLIAAFLLLLAYQVEDLIAAGDVVLITVLFFILNFLAASQDVAVDGWALTMLRPENVGYASTCNTVGQRFGYVLGYSGFLALESHSFANRFRSEPLDHGFVTFAQFLMFWAIVFCVATTLVLLLKREKGESVEVKDQHMDIFASYKNLWRILRLRNVRVYILFLLTAKMGSGAEFALAKLKMVAAGVPRETIAFFAVPLIPLELILPIVVAKWVAGSAPMKLYINAVPPSLFMCAFYAVIIFFLPFLKDSQGEYPSWVFVALFVVAALESSVYLVRMTSQMGFAAKVSDPAMGGTYMTLINTFSNIGARWPITLSLWAVDYVAIPLNDCADSLPTLSINATQSEGSWRSGNREGESVTCLSQVDGYYVLSGVCVVIGILWLFWGRPTILRLQSRPRGSWKVL